MRSAYKGAHGHRRMLSSKGSLAVFLSRLAQFAAPDALLEQYPTDSEIAATILWDAHMRGEIAGRRVADLGCGTGILGIGALALGAAHVAFVEIDARVLPALAQNLARLRDELGDGTGEHEIVHGDVSRYTGHADLVVQNPPFGTRDAGADTRFLASAMRAAPLVYSLHKSATLAHLTRVVHTNGGRVLAATRFRFPLKPTMSEHRKRIARIDVVCLRIARAADGTSQASPPARPPAHAPRSRSPR